VLSGVPRGWLCSGTESVAYMLALGANVSVQVGDSVSVGDTVAEVPSPPQVVALAAVLRLSHDAGSAAIQKLDGTTVAAGAPLGKYRMGLRARTLRAPRAGTIRGVPECGAVFVLPSEERRTLLADRPGVVAVVESDSLTIVARVFYCRVAFVTGLHHSFGRLAIAPDARRTTTPARSSTTENDAVLTALPHIDSMTELAAALRRAPGPLIIGTVSDAVAWEMLVREPGGHDDTGQMIAVLLGPGDVDGGERAIEQLRMFDGAMVEVNGHGSEMTIFPEHQSDTAVDELEMHGADEAVYLDPTRWYAPCMVVSPAEVGLLETGYRTLVVRTTHNGEGAARTPVVNVAKYPNS
jgi:hypothetical protein